MGKLLPAIMFVTAVNIFLFMVGADFPGGALWAFVQNPSEWANTSFIDWVTGTFVLLGTGLVITGAILNRDFLIFAGISAVFFSYGTSLYNWWQRVNAESLGGISNWIAIIFISPIILAFIIIILDFWRGKD